MSSKDFQSYFDTIWDSRPQHLREHPCISTWIRDKTVWELCLQFCDKNEGE